MGGLGCAGSIALFFIIPKEPAFAHPNSTPSQYLGAYSRLISNKAAIGALGYVFFVSVANDNLFVVYGAWLENRFGLGLLALGLGTSLIGAAELAGEGLTAAVSDRIGLKRAVITGLSLSVLSYFALPFMEMSLTAAMTGLAILFFIYEFTLVTSLSLCTEMIPGFRATMMSGFFAAAGIGRVLGALMGGAVWQGGGILATGCVSGALAFLGLLCLIRGLKGWHQGEA